MPDPQPRFWVVVTKLSGINSAVQGGCCPDEGRAAARLTAADGIVCYNSRATLEAERPVRRFEAIGLVGEGEVWVDGGFGAMSRRRSCVWRLHARPADAAELAPTLGFIADKARWASAFRRRCFEIPAEDFERIGEEMGAGGMLEQARRALAMGTF